VLTETQTVADRASVADARRLGVPVLFWIKYEVEPDDFEGCVPSASIATELAGVLASGTRGARFKGMACCRICEATLGSAHLTGHGFVWPEKAEHYVLQHGVWTPECHKLLVAARNPLPSPRRNR